jgi:hypothetical protein
MSVAPSVLLPWSADPHANATRTEGGFAGRVLIRGGREVHLMWRGTGHPTVLLVAGLSNRADIWNTPADESHKRTMVQLDQPGELRAAIKRVVRAVRAEKPTTGHLVASRW